MLKINDLVGYKNRKIYQDDNYFCFSVDAVILANFTTLSKRVEKVLDIGTGVAPIPLILTLRKNDLKIDAVEIQKELAVIAEKSVKLNNLENNVHVLCEDIKEYARNHQENSYDLIICNPPYFKYNEESKTSDIKEKQIARHEVMIELEDYFVVSKKLLTNNGILSMIHRSDRFLEVMELYQKYNISPTKVRFIHTNLNKESKLFFIEGIKNKKATLKIEKPFVIYDKDNKETEEYKRLLEEVN